MQIHGRTPGFLSVVVLFIERGLDMAGVTNMLIAQLLWLSAAGLFLYTIYLNRGYLKAHHLRFPFRFSAGFQAPVYLPEGSAQNEQKEGSLVHEQSAQVIRPRKISITDFLREAENRGWDIANDQSSDILSLSKGLREAGLHGDIDYFGCRLLANRTPIDVRVLIEASYWEKGRINEFGCLKNITTEPQAVAEDNTQTETYRMFSGEYSADYYDIYLDRKQAMVWLTNEAEEFRDTDWN